MLKPASIKKFLKRCFGSNENQDPKSNYQSNRLQVESLEDRVVLSANPVVTFADNHLNITGEITQLNGNVSIDGGVSEVLVSGNKIDTDVSHHFCGYRCRE